MKIKRLTLRIPEDLLKSVKILANENNYSLNKELIELIRFGIKYFFELTCNVNTEVNKSAEK